MFQQIVKFEVGGELYITKLTMIFLYPPPPYRMCGSYLAFAVFALDFMCS